ncbi:AMP-binding protein [Nocardioides pacificus]
MSPTSSHPTPSLARAILRGADLFADCVFVVASESRPHTGTLGELVREARSVATGLQARGVRPGDVVAVQLPNWFEGAVAQSAAALTGAVLLPIVPAYGAREVAFILRESGAKVLVMAHEWRGRDCTAMLSALGPLPALELIVVVTDAPESLPESATAWSALGVGSASYVVPDVAPDDVALMVYTSGTTAAPKGVQHSHRSLLAELESANIRSGTGPGSSHLAVFPPGHVAGLIGLMRVLLHGTPTVTMDVWNGDVSARLIDEHAVTATSGAPVHLAGFLDARERGDVGLTTLREFLVGGASVPPALVARADAVGIVAYRAYGSSEHPTLSCGSIDDPLELRASTDGRVTPGNEVRVVDESGAVLPRGEEGEIQTRGAELFVGYRDADLNAASFTPDGWFRTGDVGRVDPDGYLTITDRLKDIIVRGGENISSKEVEDLLARHPRVAEAAAVGVPDERYGERVAVFVLLRAGDDLSLDEVASHFRDLGAARHKTPELVRVASELPRTPAGKVQKFKLRAELGAVPPSR